MRRTCSALALLCFMSSSALAGTFNISGTLSASDFSLAVTPDPFETSFSGTLDFTDFTDGGGFQLFTDLALTSFGPITIGTTEFSTSNVFASLLYNADFDFFGINIHGAPGGSSISGGTNDFLASFELQGLSADEVNSFSGTLQPSTFIGLAVTNEGVGLVSTAETNSSVLEIAPVPLPATLPLLGGALGAAFFAARRMKRAQSA